VDDQPMAAQVARIADGWIAGAQDATRSALRSRYRDVKHAAEVSGGRARLRFVRIHGVETAANTAIVTENVASSAGDACQKGFDTIARSFRLR
jgi:hypothetical protein